MGDPEDPEDPRNPVEPEDLIAPIAPPGEYNETSKNDKTVEEEASWSIKADTVSGVGVGWVFNEVSTSNLRVLFGLSFSLCPADTAKEEEELRRLSEISREKAVTASFKGVDADAGMDIDIDPTPTSELREDGKTEVETVTFPSRREYFRTRGKAPKEATVGVENVPEEGT